MDSEGQNKCIPFIQSKTTSVLNCTNVPHNFSHETAFVNTILGCVHARKGSTDIKMVGGCFHEFLTIALMHCYQNLILTVPSLYQITITSDMGKNQHIKYNLTNI